MAELIREAVGFEGKIRWDTTHADGTPQKLLNVAKLQALGWEPKIDLERGISNVYQWFAVSDLA